MARIPIQIGARLFDSKTEAKEFSRDIIRRYAENEIIVGEDDLFLRDLVAIHPEAAQKIGCGIAHFTTQLDREWRKNRHFVIVRIDGQPTDVSFHTCIDGSNERRDVFHALRHAIADQVFAFQLAALGGGPIHCPYTSVLLTRENVHVDHAPPDTFFALATRWMNENGLSITSVPLVDSADNQWVRTMRDKAQEKSWSDFHRRNATLRAISRPANLSHVKRERRGTAASGSH